VQDRLTIAWQMASQREVIRGVVRPEEGVPGTTVTVKPSLF
jgi:hypothetical protein